MSIRIAASNGNARQSSSVDLDVDTRGDHGEAHRLSVVLLSDRRVRYSCRSDSPHAVHLGVRLSLLEETAAIEGDRRQR